MKSFKCNPYEFEDIRAFVAQRPFLRRGNNPDSLVTEAEYSRLSERQPPEIPPSRVNHIRSFIDGYLYAKG